MKDKLKSERLLLRTITEADAPRLFEIWSSPDVTKFMNIDPFTEIKQAADMIDFLNGLARENKAVRYAIIDRKSGTIIGSCGFNELDYGQRRAEIGYDLDPAFWGKQYAPEAIGCMLAYAFDELGMSRIDAKVEPENVNSIKVLRKLRFTFAGTLRCEEGADSGPSAPLLNLYTRSRED
ncbi:GNAT family N-acetyltransferase [Paenibacillus sp. UNC499MF]|uniref:GNAT family N-acetyltransferase n=1 Tax=Paenibacillus sp. UNC499MF TaxID=1502751 RepID=UPI00089FDCE6|nr:GNAT family N-acetyltransferase [Paenibacillus sp. UNC499MF]SEG67057.1 ribosomal-protein-alanine N-acetyltransferase [Paenibacillus sp. UNC499MF]